jgi:hypothetical protein
MSQLFISMERFSYKDIQVIELLAKIKVFEKICQTPKSRSHGQTFWHQQKGLCYTKYERSVPNSVEDVSKVKFFVTDRLTDRWNGHILYVIRFLDIKIQYLLPFSPLRNPYKFQNGSYTLLTKVILKSIIWKWLWKTYFTLYPSH